MKKYIFTLVFFFITLAAYSQVAVGYSIGYGKYQMKDMKGIMSNMRQYYKFMYPGLDVAILDNFPGYVTHTLNAGYRIKNHELGLTGSFLTTGGKLSYADYSGEVMGKLTANGYRTGAYYRYYISDGAEWNMEPVSVYAGISPAVTFSKLKSSAFVRIGDDKWNDTKSIDSKSTSFSVVPEIGVKYDIIPLLSLHLNMGYDVFISSKLSDLNDMKIDWSGLRLGLGLSFHFR